MGERKSRSFGAETMSSKGALSSFRRRLSQLPMANQSPRSGPQSPSESDNNRAEGESATLSPPHIVSPTDSGVQWKRGAEAEMIMSMLKKEAEKMDNDSADESRQFISLSAQAVPTYPDEDSLSSFQEGDELSPPRRATGAPSRPPPTPPTRRAVATPGVARNSLSTSLSMPDFSSLTPESGNSLLHASAGRDSIGSSEEFSNSREEEASEDESRVTTEGAKWRRNPEAEMIMMILKKEAEQAESGMRRRNTVVVDSPPPPSALSPSLRTRSSDEERKEKKIKKVSMSGRFLSNLNRSASSSKSKMDFSITRSDSGDGEAGLNSLGKEFEQFRQTRSESMSESTSALSPRFQLPGSRCTFPACLLSDSFSLFPLPLFQMKAVSLLDHQKNKWTNELKLFLKFGRLNEVMCLFWRH